LAHAVKARLILKNNYGMPKHFENDFRVVNKGEAKKSMIREPDRDI
jgi:hypothetical protein